MIDFGFILFCLLYLFALIINVRRTELGVLNNPDSIHSKIGLQRYNFFFELTND